MAIGFSDPRQREQGDAQFMQEINTTPLIDVMLVLIIMLIITIPAQLHQLSLGASRVPNSAPAALVTLELRADGSLLWNAERLADQRALRARLEQVAALPEQPQVQLRPELKTPYRDLAAVMAMAQRAGVTRLGLAPGVAAPN
jgi:biopolymer transport protein ExbD